MGEGADLIAGVSEHRCVMNFDALAATLVGPEGHHDKPSQSSGRKSVSDFATYVDVHADDVESEDSKDKGAEAQDQKMETVPEASEASVRAASVGEEFNDIAPPSTPKEELEPKLDLDADLKELKSLVETQVKELSRSIATLTSLNESLPGILERGSMLQRMQAERATNL